MLSGVAAGRIAWVARPVIGGQKAQSSKDRASCGCQPINKFLSTLGSGIGGHRSAGQNPLPATQALLAANKPARTWYYTGGADHIAKARPVNNIGIF